MINQEQKEKTIRQLLVNVGEDPDREGLLETPKRVAKAWDFWTSGYDKDPKDVMKTFKADKSDQMVIVTNIDFYSQCEHHLAPFYGQVHIGYLPNGRVLGVSKFARLVEIYARRLQIQEKMTEQIAQAVMKYLKPKGVGVIVEGIHLCMRSRGVEKQNTVMTTSCQLGSFRKDKSLKEEFLTLVNEKRNLN